LLNKKSEIVFIGAGKVAHTLLPLLVKKDYNVKGIISKDERSASLLGRKYKLEIHSADFKKITSGHRIFFVTVPDSQITIVAHKLASVNLDFRDSLFIHTSGSESSSALKLIQKKGGATASFHIMQTFPSLKQTDIANSYAAIETESIKAQRYLFSLARTLNLKAFRLTEQEKVFYHMAGVFTSNFLNANFFASEKLLNRTALNRKQHYYLFEPIINTTLSHIKKHGISESISGPVQRGDYNTIHRHIDALNKLNSAEKKLLLQSYISQSLILLAIIKQKEKRLSAGQKKLKKLLETELKKI